MDALASTPRARGSTRSLATRATRARATQTPFEGVARRGLSLGGTIFESHPRAPHSSTSTRRAMDDDADDDDDGFWARAGRCVRDGDDDDDDDDANE